MSTYSSLIIGAGGQGASADINSSKILSYANAILKNKNFLPPDIYDIDIEKAKLVSNHWGIKSIDKLKYDYDVICIATPDETHFSILKQIPSTVKLVICEKPLCNKLEDAKEIVNLYNKKNIPILVDYTRRFIPKIRKLKTQYDNGEFGKLLDYFIAYNRGLEHTGSHAVDFMSWFFNMDKIVLNDMTRFPYRVWRIELFFENLYWEERRINKDPVPNYYDNHMKYVIENAYDFLVGKEELFCTGEDALKSLEITLGG